MKVKCGHCKKVFDYEENNKVCPSCKRFCSIPKEKMEQKEDVQKSKESIEKKQIKIEPKKNLEQKADETIDLTDVVEKKENLKQILFIVTIFLIIVILPVSMAFFSDPSEKLDGPDGTIVSTEGQEIILDEVYQDIFYIRKIGYTNSGNLYVVYESNINGFEDTGYDIRFIVKDVNGNEFELGCIKSDFGVFKGPELDTYFTKAIFNYTQDQQRIVSITTQVNGINRKTLKL